MKIINVTIGFLFLICILLNVMGLTVYASDAAFVNIPVFDLDDPSQKIHSLEVKIKEEIYPSDKFYNLDEVLAKVENSLKSPEEVIITYLQYIWSGRFNDLSKFYYNYSELPASLEPDKIGKFLASYVKKGKQIKFLKKWYFGNHQLINVGFFLDGRQAAMLSLGVERVDGQYFRSDMWGEQNIVLTLFYSMANKFREGKDKKFAPREFEHSVALYDYNRNGKKVYENPLTVYFDGTFYDLQKEWIPLDKVGPEIIFVSKVIKTAIKGSDQDFTKLFAGEYYEWTAEQMKKNPQFILQQKDQYRIIKIGDTYKQLNIEEVELKHMFTLYLGKYLVHYYRIKQEPDKVRAMVISSSGNMLGLSYFKSANIYNFITDKMFVDEITQYGMGKK